MEYRWTYVIVGGMRQIGQRIKNGLADGAANHSAYPLIRYASVDQCQATPVNQETQAITQARWREDRLALPGQLHIIDLACTINQL